MKRNFWIALIGVTALTGLCLAPVVGVPPLAPVFDLGANPGDERAVTQHTDQGLIDQGRVPFKTLVQRGAAIFTAAFTEEEGRGRPTQTGVVPPLFRSPRTGVEGFNRVSGPDADSCAGCHNRPRMGGAGDNAANVFTQAERFAYYSDPFQPDDNGLQLPTSYLGAGNERNTPSLFGAGLIELLAREMTAELHAIRSAAYEDAATRGTPVRVALVTKGVDFGFLTVGPDASTNTGEVTGIDPDLIVRPFSAKGTVASIREFANHELFARHGVQAVERFGRDADADGDGVRNELSEGDVTALSVYIAQLATPGYLEARNPRFSVAIRRGETLFTQIGCASCHIPEMEIRYTQFEEPGPYNPPGTLRQVDVPRPFRFDLRRAGEPPRPRSFGTRLRISPFTDLKRHVMGNNPMINNELLSQNGLPTNVFLTRPLWGVRSSAHYLHNGRATRLRDAILAHGGEAQPARDRFAGKSLADQNSLIEYLKGLRLMSEGQRSLVVDEYGRP